MPRAFKASLKFHSNGKFNRLPQGGALHILRAARKKVNDLTRMRNGVEEAAYASKELQANG